MFDNKILDKEDFQIINILQNDGRISIADMSKKINIPYNKLLYRFRRLEERGIITGYSCFVNYEPATSGFYALIALKVKTNKIDNLIKKILMLKETFIIYDITGDYDLEVIGLFKNQIDFEKYVKNKLIKIEGIEQINSQIFLSIYHHGLRVLPDLLDKEDESQPYTLDEIDFKICQTLLIEGRAQAKEMAKNFGVTAQTISNRMNKLKKAHIIGRYHARINYGFLGLPFLVSIDLQINPSKFEYALSKIIELKPLFIDEITGDHDLRLQIAVKNTSHLREFIRDELGKIEGIQKIESYFVIHQYLKLSSNQLKLQSFAHDK